MALAGADDRAAPSGDGAAQLKVAVLAGGRSSEHDVSRASGEAVRDALLSLGHDVVAIRIERDGSWRSEADEQRLSLTPGAGLLDVDVVFPVLHGRFGEDGTVQGLLEMLDVAYVGAGVAASAVCMDKVLFKELMAAAGTVRQVAYVDVSEARFAAHAEQVLAEVAELGLPVFVKPAHMGSSVGIVRVTEPVALRAALDSAFSYDARVIVEAAAAGVEVECGVLGATAAKRSQGRSAAVSIPGEISFEGDFYDYEAKYEPGGMELLIPARISEQAAARVRELALVAFERAGCEGLARVDFFVDGEQVLLNELNTMPGFTPTSVYAKLLEASGVPYPEVADRLCRLGIERHAAQALHAF
jgi:D-alanine-D-alanine ligase